MRYTDLHLYIYITRKQRFTHAYIHRYSTVLCEALLSGYIYSALCVCDICIYAYVKRCFKALHIHIYIYIDI